jgi:hypothetical protein
MRLILLTISLLALGAIARAQKPGVTDTVSVCDLLRQPAKYNCKIVSASGIYFPGGHGLYLKGDNCEEILITKGFKWPSLIWLPLGDRGFQDRGLSVERLRKALDETGRLMNRESARKGNGVKVSKIIVTCRGRFETHDDLELRIFRRPDGSFMADGFGPGLSPAPAQLFIDSVEGVALEY